MANKGALTTKARHMINAVLKPLGFQVTTTLAEQRELARVCKWKAAGRWDQPVYSEGLGLDKERYLKFLREVCIPLRNELAAIPLTATNGSRDFCLSNGWFEFLDAEILYCLIRHLRPKHIIEIGSGNSTKLMRKAISVGNHDTHLTSIDPSPRVNIADYADDWIALPVEDVGRSLITQTLADGDILFIDSSHVVVSGGDVTYLLLEVVPRLTAGIYIHIHDISLPFDYSPKVVAEERWGWTEQYLVHAFLYRNTDFEIVWPGRYMWEYFKEEIKAALPGLAEAEVPASLWFRKTA